MRVSVLCGMLLLSSALAAQTSAGSGSSGPHILIDTVGPEGWRTRLGPTNLGSMLESERGRQLWQPMIVPMLTHWERQLGDKATYDAARACLLGYSGRVRAGIWLDPDNQQTRNIDACVLIFEPDGNTDMKVLAKNLRQWIYTSMAGEWLEVELDGEQRTVRQTEFLMVTAPIHDEGKLLIAGAAPNQHAQGMRPPPQLASSAEQLRPDSPTLKIDVALDAIFDETMGNTDDFTLHEMEVYGVNCLDDASFAIATAGPHVQVEYAQSFRGDERGIFAALMPATPAVSPLLTAVDQEKAYAVGRFDLLRIYDTILGLIGSTRDDGTAVRRQIEEDLGFDPGPGLLAHMTDEVMLSLPLTDSLNLFDRPQDTPWALTYRLRDVEAFKAGLKKLLPSFKPFFTRERTDMHGDIEIFRYGNMLSYDLWMAAGNGIFVFGGGSDAEERIIRTLDRCAQLPTTLPDDHAPPKGFAPLRRFLPPGLNGYTTGNLGSLANFPTWLWMDATSWLLPRPPMGRTDFDPDEEAEQQQALARLLREHQLDLLRSATGYADRTWRWRFYW